MHNLYIIGNGYKYLVSAVMMEEKYQDDKKRSSFESMLESFKLDKTCISKYLGKITSAESLINLNASKELKMKKYDFTTKVTRSWNTYNNGYGFYGGYYDDYYYKYYETGYGGNVSNNEYVGAFEPESNIRLDMSAGLNTNDMDEIVSQRAERFLRDDEIRMGLAAVKIESAEYNGAHIYHIVKEYDLDAINKFVSEDETKVYNLERLNNEYEYIIKIGKDTYTQSIVLPVANMTSKNMLKVNNIWANTSINKINYSKLNVEWKEHKLQEFDKEKN